MTNRLNIGFNAKDLEKIKESAQKRGLSVASLVRSIVLEWINRQR